MISLENALPLLIILLVSFLSFYFIETVVLFLLNRLIHRHWEVVVDRLIRLIVRRRSLVRILAVGSIALVIAFLIVVTPIVEVLLSDSLTLRLLTLILLITMGIIYWIGSRSMGSVVIEKRLHLYVFTIISLVIFSAVMVSAQARYAHYETAVNAAFVQPIVENIEEDYEQKTEDRLLRLFRGMVRNDECEYYDFANKQGSGLTQFVFVRDEPVLADENPEIRPKGEPLAGKNCVLETKFLLTPEGRWYQVLEQDFD